MGCRRRATKAVIEAEGRAGQGEGFDELSSKDGPSHQALQVGQPEPLFAPTQVSPIYEIKSFSANIKHVLLYLLQHFPGLLRIVTRQNVPLISCGDHDHSKVILHEQDNKSTVAGVKRARVFFDIAPFGNNPGGRIVFELYNDITAATAENFRQLATCEHGMGTNGKPLCYKGTLDVPGAEDCIPHTVVQKDHQNMCLAFSVVQEAHFIGSSPHS